MYLLAAFILQNLKKFLEPIQSYEDVLFSTPKWPICPEEIFFGTNRYYFHLHIGPFHCGEFKKNSYSISKVMRMRHFWAQTGPYAPPLKKNFFCKIISIIVIYLLAPFIVQNF